MNYPLITICIATYNHQDYIEDCLSSVISQHGNFKLQILIGDDSSDDATVAIAQKMAAQCDTAIKIYSHRENLGASQNYQFLIRKAEGDFIAHLDGDDFWLPGKLRAQLAFLDTSTSSIACYTNAMTMTNEKAPRGFFNFPQKELVCFEKLVKKGNFLNHSSILYRSEGKELILAFPENFIDFRIHLNLAMNGQLGYINQALVAYRVNSNASMLKVMPKKVIVLYYEALKSVENHMSERLFRLAMNNYTAILIVDLLVRKEIKFLSEIICKLNKESSISWFWIAVKITTYVIPFEFFNFFMKRTCQSKIEILKRNSRLDRRQ